MRPVKRYQLIDFGEFFVGILVGLAALLSFLGFLQGRIRLYIVLVIAGLAGLSLMIFLKAVKISILSEKRLVLFASKFHGFAHFLRDEYYRLGLIGHQEKPNGELLLTKLKEVGQHTVDSLSEILTESTTKEVSVCIKYFCDKESIRPAGLSKEELAGLGVTVLCRSANSQPNRRINPIDRIKDNTDLEKILIENYSEFAAADLENYSRLSAAGGRDVYRDSNTEWASSFKGKLTVPIRLRSNFSEGRPGGTAFDLLGFISADSHSKSAFEEPTNMQAYLGLMKAYADLLYQYLDKFWYYYWEDLSKNTPNPVKE